MQTANHELIKGEIEAKDIGKQFPSGPVWTKVSFRIERGEMVAILGASGSGKTTLLNCIGSLEPLSAGELIVAGRNVRELRGLQRRKFFRNKVGFLFQSYGLVDTWTVDQNLDVALEYSRLRPRQKRDAKREALGRVGLQDHESQKVFTLSGGQQQRVALARLILKHPQVVLADEPTAALDDANASSVLDILDSLRRDGSIVVISTHDYRVVKRTDRSIALDGSAGPRGHL